MIIAKVEILQMDVACAAGVLKQGTEHRQGAQEPGDGVAGGDSDGAAASHDGERFEQELGQDAAAGGADRFQHADLPGALGHRNEHDIGRFGSARLGAWIP